MNRYMKKWHFGVPFTWTADGITIKAVYRGFINTIHECNSLKDIPNEIKDFHITLWTGEDTIGKKAYHGVVKYEDGEDADLSICGPMFIEKATKSDGSHVYYNDIPGCYKNSFIGDYTVYNFPKLEATIKNSDIKSTEYLILSDGWTRLEEENRDDYSIITTLLKSCEDMKKVIEAIRSKEYLSKCRNESEMILKKALVNKYVELIGIIFKYKGYDKNISNDIDYDGDTNLITNKFKNYVSENY